MRIDTEDFGRIEIGDVALPDDLCDIAATYTYSGKVFVLYRRAADPAGQDWYRAAVVNDDGSGFREIFAGAIPQHPKANGIRHMMFADNTRVLLGDYVLECSPDVDTCEQAELVDVEYPWGLEEDPLTTHHWSEIIIAPDNSHIAWTILRADMGAAAALGRLRRVEDRYVIDDPQLISTPDELVPDPAREGYVIPQPVRGGEVKQFVCGGTAISAVGGLDGLLPDSVVQDLGSDELTQITRTPGYDETTIFSPDERLGIVMTSRASKRTNPAIFGLLPRPHAILTGMSLGWIVYFYTVGGVRDFREGNIGPVLIDIDRSRTEPGYQGVPLNNPDESWVYVSPMSWHPGGRKAMWLETLRGSERAESGRQIRVRRAELLDYQSGAPVAVRPVPDHVPYGITGQAAEDALLRPAPKITSGRIAGRHSGYLDYQRQPGNLTTGAAGSASSTYVGYSDDGRSFYDGFERVVSSFTADTVYQTDLRLTGEQTGEMRLRATWSSITSGQSRLLFDTDEDGLAKSHGFASFGDVRLNIEDLVE